MKRTEKPTLSAITMVCTCARADYTARVVDIFVEGSAVTSWYQVALLKCFI